ncbi:MAG: DUF3883 domain-containing protein [Flavobacteriaceae bacterium]
MDNRDKSILAGLYLSKYDIKGLSELGFNTFQEAFNIIGYSLQSKPSSIKNYRDEFDPLFPNNRKGWHNRPIREYCKKIYTEFQEIDFHSFSEIIKSLLIENYDLQKFLKTINKDYNESISKRQLTGKAAEEYFKKEYKNIDFFKSFELQDTTLMACGFDYKLSYDTNFYCIEVKGLSESKGSIQMTENEFNVAEKLKEKYCLFVVKNFKEKPIHDIIFNPLNSQLNFKEIKKEIIQTTYNTMI